MQPPLHAWPALAPLALAPITVGRINATWRVDGPAGPVAVVQRLNTSIFDKVLHEDLDAVTTHLAAKGLLTPRLLRTASGALFHEDGSGVWRALSWVGTRTPESFASLDEAWSAGRLVGRFHAALDDLAWTFRNPRKGVHDTPRHAAALVDALARHADDPLHPRVAALGRRLLDRWEALRTTLPALPERVVHGDLKITNLRFDGPEAVALVDLDTLQRDTLGAELGDALRSWCGPVGEVGPEPTFDLDVFRAAIDGWKAGMGSSPIPEGLEAALLPSVERIATELAMRFAADALNRAYFAWDRERWPDRGEQMLAAALGQEGVAEAVRRVRG